MRRLAAVVVIVGSLLGWSVWSEAQSGSRALVAVHSGSPFDGFIGPFRGTATSVDVHYMAICINGQNPIHKFPVELNGVYPNGSTLAQVRDILTTAVVNACAAGLDGTPGIAVARGAVLLPAVQFGQ